jgi:hypothetical protein
MIEKSNGVCDYCGLSFVTYPYRLRQKNIFCCENHAKLYRFENGSKQKNCIKCGLPLKMGEGWATPLKKRKNYLCDSCKIYRKSKTRLLNAKSEGQRVIALKARMNKAIAFLKSPEKCRFCGHKITLARHNETPNLCPDSRCMFKSHSETPQQKISRRMRGRMRASLNGKKGGISWETLVGYTREDLKRHLESKFMPGMSWENIKDWHIDHIIPISAFNYQSAKDTDFKRCWALSNLQPLWIEDNLRKGDKLLFPMQASLSLYA